MSKLKYISLISLLAILLFATGCDAISKSDLSGTWKEKEQSGMYIPIGEDGGTGYDFKQDGTYQFLGIGSDKGKYEIKNDKITMKPTEASMGRQSDYTIKIQDKGKSLSLDGKTFKKEKE